VLLNPPLRQAAKRYRALIKDDRITKMENKKIQVHKFLSEVFGRETTMFDLLAIMICSISFAVLTLFVKWNADITITKKIILTILALDIGGGVVANFTTGTNNYYAESLRKRYLFVFFHLLQPSILIWIFPSELIAIFGVSLCTLTSSIIVLNIKKQYNQRIVAVTLLLFCLFLSIILNYSDPLTKMIMQLFSVKLILEFSVNWNLSYRDERNVENKTTTR
jgi:positive regulator of sigma E activity